VAAERPPTSRRAPAFMPALPERLRLVVVAGPDAGRALDLGARVYVIGKDPACDLPLTDAAVSWRHLELDVLPGALELRDLGSTNGSFYGGVRFERIQGGVGTAVSIGDTELRVVSAEPRAESDHFGALYGPSRAMREVFALARRAAEADTTVLVTGETGTGKELLAEAIAASSRRRGGPFVVCDLSALPRTVIESELFGHVRGAFTGAERDRRGAFAEADGGTLFLDEIGELDLDVQPRLLRALEARQVKPVGRTTYEPVDARVIAATNRDLGEEVRAGRFRRDLFHRLAVVRIAIPPLRERAEDIPALARRFLDHAAAAARRRPPEIPPTAMAALAAYDWPGNVRELKNVLDRAFALSPDAPVLDSALLGLEAGPQRAAEAIAGAPAALTFKEAREHLVDAWEREYLADLLARAGGNVSEAARRAGIARISLHRLLRKHGLGRGDESIG
jgi:DNA-binding NtrC family response regulator